MQNNAEKIICELWEEKPEVCCPYVRFNGKRCCCEALPSPDNFGVCDIASLQIWCLDPEHYKSCHFFPKAD